MGLGGGRVFRPVSHLSPSHDYVVLPLQAPESEQMPPRLVSGLVALQISCGRQGHMEQRWQQGPGHLGLVTLAGAT